MAAVDREAWDEFEQLFAPEVSVESRRKIVGFKQNESHFGRGDAPDEALSRDGDLADQPRRYRRARRAPGSLSTDVWHCRCEPRGAAGRDSSRYTALTRRVESRCRSGSTSKTWTPRSPNSTPCTPASKQSIRKCQHLDNACVRRDRPPVGCLRPRGLGRGRGTIRARDRRRTPPEDRRLLPQNPYA